MKVLGLDHVQLAMPRGGEEAARTFYQNLLGLAEIEKPPQLASRGGVWFACGSAQLHLGVEEGFRPAKKAHPALLVSQLEELLARLRGAGLEVVDDAAIPGVRRAFVFDPFGNRVELIDAQGADA
jgi:catechol 2,3-dioxygenase-like lactoylglutathione lyase family enzyme